jgi:hypothetical protein
MDRAWPKLTAYLKTFRKRPTPKPVYSVGFVRLPNPDVRTASVGDSFSTPTSISSSFSPHRSASAAVMFSEPQPFPTGFSFEQTK